MSIKYSTTSPTITEANLRKFREALGAKQVAANQPISELLGLGLGGVAEIVVTALSTTELVTALKLALEMRLPYQVIGGGTGVLASDVGFPGVLILNKSSLINFSDELRQVVVDSGFDNTTLVTAAASRSFGGIEYLMGIPGTIGGAVATTAGYQGNGIESSLKEVVVLLPKNTSYEIVSLPVSELSPKPLMPMFNYPQSFKPVILTIRLQLAALTQREIINRISRYRSIQQKHRANSLGYIFEGSLADLHSAKVLKALRTDLVSFDRADPNYLVINSKKVTTSRSVRDFIQEIKTTAKAAGYQLAERLDYLGYWPEEDETANSVDAESI